MKRRHFLIGFAGAGASLFLQTSSFGADGLAEILQKAIEDFQNSPDLSAPNYAFREFAEDFPALKLERAPNRLAPSSLKISTRAQDLIVAFEVSSEHTYTQRYQKPTWPGGQSGATIGVGYDIGYVKADELQADWASLVGQNATNILLPACGVTGAAAQALVPRLSNVAIPWDKAVEQFGVEMSKYVTLTQESLPNFSSLSEDCRGALVSLVYNRGPSFDVPESSDARNRYSEMRNIKRHMTEKKFSLIPSEMRNMERLWPGVAGLVRRREAEAALFELGLVN